MNKSINECILMVWVFRTAREAFMQYIRAGKPEGWTPRHHELPEFPFRRHA
jgi:hypothetical protein